MTKLSALFWLGLVGASGFATYSVKYAVQGVDGQLHQVQQQTAAEQQEIRVLTAEWTYVSQPARLADLNQRFLHLVPITAKQLQQAIDNIPLRPPEMAPTPVAPAASAVAAATPAIAAPAPVIAETFGPGLVVGADPAVAALQRAAAHPVIAVAASYRATMQRAIAVRLATAAPPASLDALFAKVAEKQP